MKKARNQLSRKSTTPVKVLLTVTQFRDVLCEKGAVTDYQLAVNPRNRQVRLEKDTLFIKPPGAVLQFALASAKGDRDNYYPLGIAYLRDGKSKSDELRLGLVNFPQKNQVLKGRTITVTDSYRDREKGIRYKFSIFVQRGSDGKIGIIDPAMVHDNSGFH